MTLSHRVTQHDVAPAPPLNVLNHIRENTFKYLESEKVDSLPEAPVWFAHCAFSPPYQMLSPHNQGLFRRAISQCGVAVSPWALQRDPQAMARKVKTQPPSQPV